MCKKEKWTFNLEADKFHLPCIYSFMALWCWTKDFSFSLGRWIEIVLRWRWNLSPLRGQQTLKWLYRQPAPTLTPAKPLCRHFCPSASQKIHMHFKQQQGPLPRKWHRKCWYCSKSSRKLKLMLHLMKNSRSCPCVVTETSHTCMVVMSLDWSPLWFLLCNLLSVSQSQNYQGAAFCFLLLYLIHLVFHCKSGKTDPYICFD